MNSFFMFYVTTLLSLPFALLGKGLTTENRYATESSSVRLVCPFGARNGRMTWRGPPHFYPYSINTLVNSTIFNSNHLKLTGNFQMGEYTLVIQNFNELHVGSYQCETFKKRVAFRHRFNVILKDSETIEMKPSTLVCKNYSYIVIRCSLKETNTGFWKNIWTHNLNRQHIRHPDISINGLISTLTIDACSFQDRGNYTCSWYSDTVQYNSSTSVDVVSKPVIVHKSSNTKDGFIIFKIRLYSNPEPFQIKWYDVNQLSDDLIDVNSTYRETTVETNIYGSKVNGTGYLVFLRIKQTLNRSSSVYRCHIKNNIGYINVVFQEELDNDMFSRSAVEISTTKYEPIRSSIFDSLNIYIPGASCVLFVCVSLSLTAAIIVLKKKSCKLQKGHAADINLSENSQRVVSDSARKDGRRKSLKSYHEYEEIKSLSSLHSDHLNTNQAYANDIKNITIHRCYVNTVCFHIYEDLDKDTRSELREYDQCVV